MATAEEFLSEFRGGKKETAESFLSDFLGGTSGDVIDSDFAVRSALELGGDTPDDEPMEAQEYVDPGILDYLKAVPEVGKTLAAGLTVGTGGYVHGFVEGLFEEIKGREFGTPEAAKRIEQKAMERSGQMVQPFAPESEAGSQIIETIGEAAEMIPPVIPMAASSQALSSTTRAAMAPLAARAKELSKAALSARPILEGKFGPKNKLLLDLQTGLPSKELAKSLNKKGAKFSLILDDPNTLPSLTTKGSVDDIVDDVIRKRIKQGSGNESLSKLMLDGKKIITDELGIEAERQGFAPGDIASAKNSNMATRNAMAKQLNIKRRIHGDSSVALDVRPSKIAGDELMKRFAYVRDEANELRNKLNRIAEGSAKQEGTLPGPGVIQGLKNAEIDVSGIEKSVIDGLRDLNVNIPDEILNNTTILKDYLRASDAFTGSDISKDRISQKLIRDTIDLLSEPGKADALRAHRIKRQIDTTVDFRRRVSGGLTDSGENYAKSIRRSLNEAIREVNPQYAEVNDKLSRALESMNAFRESIPKKVNFFGDNLEEAFGQEVRKLLSNYAARQQIRNSIKNLDDTSKFFGGHFDVDVNKLVQFNKTLDDKFGATAKGSLQGDVESAVRTLRPKEILKDKASKAVIDKINELRKIDDEESFNVMQRILKRTPGNE